MVTVLLLTAFGLVCLAVAFLLFLSPIGITFPAWRRRRRGARAALALGLVALVAAPLLAIAQEAASPMFQFDPGAIVNALPLGAGAKAAILFALPFVYVGACLLRRLTPPSSAAGRVVRVLLDGWKHPEEKPADLGGMG